VSGPELTFSRAVEPFDYLMFRGEANPRSRSSLASVSLLDRNPGIERLRSTFDRASRNVLRLRQRIVAPALPITGAEWIVDPDFDLGYHVRVVRATGTGGLRELLDLTTALLSTPLDTARPLWEARLVEDVHVDGACAALVMKVSHSLTDGEGALQLLTQLFDFERDADRGPMPPVPVPEDRSPTDLVRTALARGTGRRMARAGHSVGVAARGVAGAVRDPGGTVEGARAMVGSLRRVVADPPAPPSPLLQRRGLGRRLDTTSVPLDGLRDAARSAGCSVNDAYISAVCGALRLYHEHLGAPVDALPLAMPISRRSDEDAAGGNRFGATRFAAPIALTDPIERMRRVREIARAGADEPAMDAFDVVAPLISHLPTVVLGTFASTATGTDIQASNVRGYPSPPFVAGAEITETYWFGPLPGVAMMVVLMSQAGTCFIGVHSDTASVTDGALFCRCLEEGFAEVLAVAAATSR